MYRRFLAQAATAALVAGCVVALSAPARAATSAVVDGSARFEVLTPTLIRMEYAGDGAFQDATTFNAVNRNFPVPSYTTTVTADGYREIRTSTLTLRYKQGSGPFTAANLSVALSTGVTAAPAFPSYCAFGTACQAENALLTGFASPAYDHTGFTGSAFVAGYEKTGSGLQIDVSGVPSAGSYKLQVRYANAKGATGTLSTKVNSTAGPQLTLPQTANWDSWGTASVTVSVPAGTSTISVLQNASDTGQLNIDSIALTPTSTTTYPAASTALVSTGYGAGPADTLGGWSRSLDNPAVLPVPEHPGILTRSGWYLLDDSRTALLSASHVVTDRPSHGSQPYQDGYFFGYGQNYRQGLGDLNALAGNTALLPQSAYGVWYSRYYGYSTADYQNSLIPTFRSTFTPIDWLVIDTDWKSPSQWNGWNWNSALFPDPTGFMSWTKQQGLNVSLNIHTSIAGNDPQYAAASSTAGGTLIPDGGNYAFDWSNPNHMSAYMNLHKPFEQQGVRTWWLDYCTGCGASTASDPHVSPDTLINQAYADSAAARGLRPFSFGRIGGSEMGSDDSNFAIGPWPERRDTMQFTGDTPATWDMLAFEARFAGDEAAAGLSNVSHDIGSFHGGHLADDMYVRWVQLGAFQPVDRLHSDHGDRLPWNYTGAAATNADAFLRLREALVPYTYTLAAQARQTGVPIVRPLYLNYPANNEAYTNPTEYLYGDNVLVAPIVSSTGSRTLWVPPGTWTDYFTGQAYTGPSTATISDGLSQMPVLIKAGGIMPTRTDYVDYAAQRPLTQLTVNVTGGADGSFSLYSDAGEGTSTASTNAPLSWTDSSRTLAIGAQTGSFTGAPTARSYTLRLSNASAPTAVSVDGVQLPETAWSYNGNSRTVTVSTASLSLTAAHTVSLSGSGAGNPAGGEVLGVGGLCLDVRGGASTDGTALQVYGCNHTAAQTFTYGSDNTVRTLGKCLTAGAGVTISTCSGATSQQWTHQSNGALVSGGQCLDVPNGNTTPGAVQLQMYTCNGTAAQTWKLPPGQLTGPGGLCVDVANGMPASGTAVQLYGCNGTDAQRWSAPGDQTLRTLGKCLDVANAGTANGTPVQLWDCDGTAAQVFTTRADGTLYNPQSGRCLDDPNNNQQNGDLLRIWDCNTTTAQKFRLG